MKTEFEGNHNQDQLDRYIFVKEMLLQEVSQQYHFDVSDSHDITVINLTVTG